LHPERPVNGFDVAPGWLRREIEAAGALARDAAA